VHKYIKVWIEKRKNRTSTSYTLEWREFGQRRFLSLGPHATLSYAREARRRKEAELNSTERMETLVPIAWDDFKKKYLDTFYPGHDRDAALRKEQARGWSKSPKTMKREKLALDSFTRIVKPYWCHEITAENRERFIQKRLGEVGSALSVDAELRTLRLVCNVMAEWKHRPEGSNPFAGRGKATTGARRRRHKGASPGEKATYYTVEQIRALLTRANQELAEDPGNWNKKRLRALVYFVAYTGCRINEAVYLEWHEIDWDRGVAWLHFKVENDLKTEGSQAPFGLPDRLLTVLREWEQDRTCTWVFPNSSGKPWVTAGPGYKHLDQLKALAKRAGLEHATWKMFRHSLSTHGKGRFGMTKEQVRAQLRHTTDETQEQYTHDDLANLRDAVKGVDFENCCRPPEVSAVGVFP
jgi:integrase